MTTTTSIHVALLATAILFSCGGASNDDALDSGIDGDASIGDGDGSVEERPVSECRSQAGSRLAAEYIEPVEGLRQDLRIIDTLEGVECRFLLESDGTHTCYPSDTSSQLFFKDSSCTSMVAVYQLEWEPKGFTETRVNQAPCSSSREYRRVGNITSIGEGDPLYIRNNLNQCQQITAPNRKFYDTSEVLPQSAFVNASLQAASPDTRISSGVFVGDDGSSLCARNSLVDSVLELKCSVRNGGDALPYCVPTGASSERYFSDELCEVEERSVPTRSCGAATIAIEDRFDSSGVCPSPTRRAFRVSDEMVSERYRAFGENCRPRQDQGDTFLRVGEEILASELAAMTQVIEESEVRLRRILDVTADRFGVFRNRWLDTELATECQFQAASDGSLRCLPDAMRVGWLSTEPDCTNNRWLASVNECQALGYFSSRANNGQITIIEAVPVTVPVYGRDENSLCVEREGVFYEKGMSEVPVDNFVLGEPTL